MLNADECYDEAVFENYSSCSHDNEVLCTQIKLARVQDSITAVNRHF